MSTNPRPYTRDEMLQMLVEHLIGVVEYWSHPERERGPYRGGGPMSTRERVSGAVFSVLAAIDGTSMGLPAFVLAPDPHPDDERERRFDGEDWWPRATSLEDQVDLAGGLHELFSQLDRPYEERDEKRSKRKP